MAIFSRASIGMAVAGAGLLLAATACRADAGEAASAMPCNGPAPVAGVEIRGPVLHVIDGQTLCVALGFSTDHWVKLRLADAASPVRRTSSGPQADPRGALMQVALAKTATCRTLKSRSGAIVARCEIDGRPIGDQLDDPDVTAASWAWR